MKVLFLRQLLSLYCFIYVGLVENTQLSYKIYFLDASVFTNTSAVFAVSCLSLIPSRFLFAQIHLQTLI
jgi:hypothetical protein